MSAIEDLQHEIYDYMLDSDHTNMINTTASDIIDDINESISKETDVSIGIDISGHLDWMVSDRNSDVIEVTVDRMYDFLKELNEIDDEDFIERMNDDPTIFEYRFNPSELVIETKKLFDL